MTDTSLGSIIIVCYPGGAGGSFLASALQSSVSDVAFKIDPVLGHCHNNQHFRLPDIFHGPSIQSFKQELTEIKMLRFVPSSTWAGHYRNIVAIRETIEIKQGYEAADNARFVKINVDPDDANHARFLTNMLRKKANSFPNLSEHKFFKQTLYYIQSWYWIENQITRKATTNLSLADVFSSGLENMLGYLLTEFQIQRFRQHHQSWLSVQNLLYPDTMKLLHD